MFFKKTQPPALYDCSHCLLWVIVIQVKFSFMCTKLLARWKKAITLGGGKEGRARTAELLSTVSLCSLNPGQSLAPKERALKKYLLNEEMNALGGLAEWLSALQHPIQYVWGRCIIKMSFEDLKNHRTSLLSITRIL